MGMNNFVDNLNPIDTWYNKVVLACNHHDSDQAYSALRKWDEMIALVSPEQKLKLMELREMLAYTAFPSLPIENAQDMMAKHFISFLRSPVDIDEMIRNRFLYAGYGFEEGDRQALRESALKNTEQIGGKSVSEWLGALDTALAKAENPENVMMQFFTQDQTVMAMSRIDQAILRRLFQVYYDFFAFPVVTVYGLAESARKLAELEKAGVKEINLKEFFAPDRTAPRESTFDILQNVASSRQSVSAVSENVNLSLLKALGKFEKLGGQQVTNSKIVIKGQNDPVRPTIFNWLRAYRDELGVGAHDAVTRGQFLFQSLNGKGLSANERDQVGMLLKSIDENSPLSIDAGRQEVIFSESRIKNQESRMESKPFSRDIPNTKYEIQNTEKNISRAVFEIPRVTINNQQGTINSQQSTDNSRQGAVNNQQLTDNGEQSLPARMGDSQQVNKPLPTLPLEMGGGAGGGRPSAFEQAKAIQQANRENKISMARTDSETVELGRVNISPVAPLETSRPRIEPLQGQASSPHGVAPAPRAISFEPAKIDTFSFGASTVASTPIRVPSKPAMEKSFEPKFPTPIKSNVGSVSFSTKHVMPAEKETVARTSVTPPAGGVSAVREHENSGLTDQERLPASGGERPLPAPPIQKPIAPANRYRITPTSRREEKVKDETPSPHVVDLRN